MFKLYLVGEFLPERIEIFYNKAFLSLGCEVRHFDTGLPNKLCRIFWPAFVNKMILNDLNKFNPDLVLVFKGFCLWPQTIRSIKEKKRCLIFCYNTDSPFNISAPGSSNKNILNSIPCYDLYLTFGDKLIDGIKKAGAGKVEVLSFGFDPDSHAPVEVSEEEKKHYGNDLVFVGSWDEEREGWLSNLKDFDLGIWGGKYWIRRCKDRWLRAKWRGREMYARDQSRVLGASKISLNILRVQNKGSHNMRTFESPARGAFVLAERSPQTSNFFAEGKEAVYFSTAAELKEKARYYLMHPQEREKIAAAGRQRCISSGYSYLDRARYVLEIFNKLSGITR